MKRESMVIFRSFYEAGRFLNDKERLDFYDRILNYGIEGIEKTKSAKIEMLFGLIKPNIDASQKKYDTASKQGHHGIKGKDHGIKGGRPKTEFKTSDTPNNPLKGDTKPNPLDVDVDVDVDDNIYTNKNNYPLNIIKTDMLIEERGGELLDEFIDYRSEPDKQGKEKRHKQKTWSLKSRLTRRKKNKETNFGRNVKATIKNIEEFGVYMDRGKYNEAKEILGKVEFFKMKRQRMHYLDDKK